MRLNLAALANAVTRVRTNAGALTHSLVRGLLVMIAAYVLASGVSAYLMTGMLSTALLAFNRLSAQRVQTTTISLGGSTTNYREIEKAVKDRNLFNAAGEFPDEKAVGGGDDRKLSSFDINAPCGKPTVNVDLIGTIYLGGPGSIATLQEKGYGESDVYREGDLIVGNDQVAIAKIERSRVILNNHGLKECLELSVEPPKRPGDGFPALSTTGSGGVTPSEAPVGNDCLLQEKYVQEELGPGFGTIIQKARLVPNTADNQMNGFKIFAIDPASLLAKTGLQNGDVITQVNETSLKQPEQGFALYQAFQDDKEVRIHILRQGTQPMMITCRIR